MPGRLEGRSFARILVLFRGYCLERRQQEESIRDSVPAFRLYISVLQRAYGNVFEDNKSRIRENVSLPLHLLNFVTVLLQH